MAEKETLSKPEAPEQPEQPEEGFVPYAAEAAEEEKQKGRHRLRVLIPLILLIVVLIAAALLLILPKFNRYHKVMKELSFDYRMRKEEIGDREGITPGMLAAKLATELKDQPLRVKAACYLIDESGKEDGTVVEYNYFSSKGLEQLDTCTSAKDSLRKEEKAVRIAGAGYERKEDGKWVSAENEYIPDLRDYFFGVQTHGAVTVGCYDSYHTTVNGKAYVCEIWLIEEQIGSKTVYNTVYRYYDGEKLAGVIILRDDEKLNEVYDISDYEINAAP